ncbi:DNA-binding transcriptional LysR family regulator [Murinocardiopsis flavida]|uniref:DNA-binding transcriptional LysR family regulator n=1 Tax=Murinocardiopsis flavida TaxID=645275 RepID=A0A2P8DQ52_9ACTN|nr:LysR family transcriptional regulator [Murinocardiopsis flavida]PSK99357.1 DNA-binding transcriptional LysR family regulator [Murinocardiopsis flavida]
MTNWDLGRLRVLRTLADRGTVRAAAEALRMTPSAVSQQLATLSRELGTPMLEAHGRRVRLTSAGEAVLRHADLIFAQVERAGAELEGYVRGVAGRVRVGAFATAIPSLVVPLSARLRHTHPDLELRVREAEAAEVYELLALGEVDLALSLAAEVPAARDAKFAHVPLMADPLDVALPAAHRWAEGPPPRLADLAAEPWIFGAGGPWRDITLAVCASAGFVPENVHVAADWTAILALVGAGMGIALVPRLAARRDDPAVAVRVLAAETPRRHVVAAVRAGAEERPPLALLLAELRREAAESPSVQ